MKKFLSLLLLASVLSTSVVQPMKRPLPQRSEPEAKRPAIGKEVVPAVAIPENDLVNPFELCPNEVITLILSYSMNIDPKAPWTGIEKLYELVTTCKQFEASFPTLELIAQNMGIPLMHFYAGRGMWRKIIDLKVNHNHQPECCINYLDHFDFRPLNYAQGNGHEITRKILTMPMNNDGFASLLDLDIVHDQFGKFIRQIRFEAKIWRPLNDLAQFKTALQNLIEQGNVNHRNNNGLPLLHYCLSKPAFLQHLLECDKIDVDIRGKNGMTALYKAAREGNLELLPALIENGASLNVKDNFGQTPLYIAILNNKVECLQALLTSGANANIQDNNGITPLHRAASYGHLECLQTLLGVSGIIVNVQNKMGMTPLHAAAQNGKLECLLELIKSGATIDIKNIGGMPALTVAANGGHAHCIQYLIGQNACLINNQCNINVFNVFNDGENFGRFTPLHFAALKGHVTCVAKLLELGADVTLQNQEGKTALDLAREKNHQAIVDLLEAQEAENK